MKLKVYYGFSKLTKKTMKKPELAVFYENSWMPDNEDWVAKRMLIVYTRLQTDKEMEDRVHSNRVFTKYSLFVDEKPFYGDIEKLLDVNFKADENHVSEEERNIIRDKLYEAYYPFYNRKPQKNRQLNLGL